LRRLHNVGRGLAILTRQTGPGPEAVNSYLLLPDGRTRYEGYGKGPGPTRPSCAQLTTRLQRVYSILHGARDPVVSDHATRPDHRSAIDDASTPSSGLGRAVCLHVVPRCPWGRAGREVVRAQDRRLAAHHVMAGSGRRPMALRRRGKDLGCGHLGLRGSESVQLRRIDDVPDQFPPLHLVA